MKIIAYIFIFLVAAALSACRSSIAPIDVALSDQFLAIIATEMDEDSRGTVILYQRPELAKVAEIAVGYDPVRLAFTPTGNTLLVSNRGAAGAGGVIDPEGSISIIDLTDIDSGVTVNSVDFRAFSVSAPSLIASGVRLSGDNISVVNGLEPGDITFSADGRLAWVALPDNHAYALISIDDAVIERIVATTLMPVPRPL